MAQVERRQLVSMLAAGFKNHQIAAALDVTDSAVTQALEADPTIRKDADEASQFKEIDGTLNSIEALVARKLKDAVIAESNPMKLANILKVVNGARRRTTDGGSQQQAALRVVQLQLPERFMGKLTIETNSNNEVTKVGEKAMISMPATQLLQNVKDRKEQQGSMTLEVTSDEPQPIQKVTDLI